MKTITGKMLGQSGPELLSAVLFSFLVHLLFFFGALLFFGLHVPAPTVPPSYRVTLVSAPADLPLPSAAAPAPIPEAPPEPAPPKQVKKAARPAARGARKGGMAGLGRKAAEPEREYVAEDRPASPGEAATAGAQQQGAVALSAPQASAFGPYVAIVREKIERNWNPPPGARETKATVVFRIGRGGRVSGTNLQEPSGNFYFDQAAMRAILSSTPFPPLPEGYGKDAMDFSVDLMAKD